MRPHDLLTSNAVRQAALHMLDDAIAGRLQFWTLNLDELPSVADLVAEITRRNYPEGTIPFHSRWRHFVVNGQDRWAEMRNSWSGVSPAEVARRAFDLVIPSVLLDAGSGRGWRYMDAVTGQSFTSSEGLALASLALYQDAISKHPHGALDAGSLEGMTDQHLADCFQVADVNLLTGVASRANLMQSLGRVCRERPDVFALCGPVRPGGLVDTIIQKSPDGRISAAQLLALVLEVFGPIWPSRLRLDGVHLGDSWVYERWKMRETVTAQSIVPFHKLSQWLTFSLVEPLLGMGIAVSEIDELTGLAEYRNGGLFVDGNVIKARDQSLLEDIHEPAADIVIEWRALTVALLDRLKPMVAHRLGLDDRDFPLPCLLEGGSWAAGRFLAQSLRKDRSPPVRIISDGTIF